MEPFRFSFKNCQSPGSRSRTTLHRRGFDFRYRSRFKSGSIYGRVHYLDIIAPKFTDEMIKEAAGY